MQKGGQGIKAKRLGAAENALDSLAQPYARPHLLPSCDCIVSLACCPPRMADVGLMHRDAKRFAQGHRWCWCAMGLH